MFTRLLRVKLNSESHMFASVKQLIGKDMGQTHYIQLNRLTESIFVQNGCVSDALLLKFGCLAAFVCADLSTLEANFLWEP